MKTFQQFLEEAEKEPKPTTFNKKQTKKIKDKSKKIADRVSQDVERQKRENPGQPAVANFNKVDKKTGEVKYSKPGSTQRQAEIAAMLRLTKQWKKDL